MIKIAIAGKMRSGKDTCFEYLRDKYFHDALGFSFAYPIYKLLYMCQDFCGFTHQKERDFLQFIGDWGRQHDNKVWITVLMREIAKIQYTIPVIVTDARYFNELIELDKQHFVIIKIEASEEIRIARGATDLEHSSEQEVDSFKEYDFIIKNNGSFEELYSQLDSIVAEICTFN